MLQTREHRPSPRPVVSFVRRSTRMRPPQQRAWERSRHRFLVPVQRADTSTSVADAAPLDLTAVFGRPGPLIVEVGPGAGEALVEMAKHRPEANLLAFEVYQPALARLVKLLADTELSNVRLVEADAVEGISRLLPPATVEELWTFFPDPWPKVRHHKRRILSPAFAAVAADKITTGGRWRLATDWSDYARQMHRVLDAHPAFVGEHSPGAPRSPDRALTRFEQRGLDAGRQIFDLVYRRR